MLDGAGALGDAGRGRRDGGLHSGADHGGSARVGVPTAPRPSQGVWSVCGRMLSLVDLVLWNMCLNRPHLCSGIVDRV